MIWPMNREVFHSIFLGVLLLSLFLYVFGSVRIHHFNPFLSGARKPLQPSQSKINCDHSPLFPGVATLIQMSMTYSILTSKAESHRRRTILLSLISGQFRAGHKMAVSTEKITVSFRHQSQITRSLAYFYKWLTHSEIRDSSLSKRNKGMEQRIQAAAPTESSDIRCRVWCGCFLEMLYFIFFDLLLFRGAGYKLCQEDFYLQQFSSPFK